MKKWICLCLSAVLCLGFAACGANDVQETSSQVVDTSKGTEDALADEIKKQLAAVEYFDPCVVTFALDTAKADAEQVISLAYEAVDVKMDSVRKVEDCYAERGNCYALDGGNVTLKVESYELLPDVAQTLYEHEAVSNLLIERNKLHYELMTEGEKLAYYAAVLHHDAHDEGEIVIVPIEACYTPKATLFVARQLYTALGMDETVLTAAHENATPVCKEDENGASYTETTEHYEMNYRTDENGEVISISITLKVAEARLAEALYRARANGAIESAMPDVK